VDAAAPIFSRKPATLPGPYGMGRSTSGIIVSPRKTGRAATMLRASKPTRDPASSTTATGEALTSTTAMPAARARSSTSSTSPCRRVASPPWSTTSRAKARTSLRVQPAKHHAISSHICSSG